VSLKENPDISSYNEPLNRASNNERYLAAFHHARWQQKPLDVTLLGRTPTAGSDPAKYLILKKNTMKKGDFWTLERHF
jgi:hypothetical protein